MSSTVSCFSRLRTAQSLAAVCFSLGAVMAHAADAAGDKLLAQVQEAARQQLQKQADGAGLQDALFDIAVVANGKSALPCKLPVAIEGADTRTPSRMRFVAICRAPEGWRSEFVVRAHVSAKVVVVAAAVAAGKALSAADMAVERHDVTATADPVSDPESVLGMASRRALRPGDILRKSSLAAPTLVRRGEAVMIVVRKQQVEISVAGEAMESGVRDATVRVRNVSTGNVIHARIVGPGTVEPVDMAPTHSPD